MKDKVLSFRISTKQHHQIELISYAERRSVSNWVRKVLEEALEKEKI